MDKIFQTQLEKTRVDYFDYYLLHDLGVDHYKKYQKYGCFEWLADKKKAGFVKHMGFSYHDRADFLDVILSEHPEVEFVQLQINYLDWESEAIESRKCYEVCVNITKKRHSTYQKLKSFSRIMHPICQLRPGLSDLQRVSRMLRWFYPA